jgi:ribosomal protein S18 acetylase RimI-like enzyme
MTPITRLLAHHRTLALSPTIKIVPASTDPEWDDADVLIQELIQWDVRQCESLGFEPSDVIRTFYPDGLADIRRQSAAPGGCFLIASGQRGAVGCAGYRPLAAGTCELYNVYVRTSDRGLGVGTLLVNRLKSIAISEGYKNMYLETASFMTDAHRLYRSLGFEVINTYRPLPSRFAAVTIFMRCTLDR